LRQNRKTGQSDQQGHEGKEHPATKDSAISIRKENWEDILAVEISLKSEGYQLAGRAIFCVVDPRAGEVLE
jgi:hypothetical protein